MRNIQFTGFIEQGQRQTIEDAIYPNIEDLTRLQGQQNLFVVCDGVGIYRNGIVAAEIVCKEFPRYFEENKILISNQEQIEKGVLYVEEMFDVAINKDPQLGLMGTTMTLLHLHEQGATIAHIGDSRVYHFRNGKILFQTADHSPAYEEFSVGLITEEELREHPEKNRISKSIQGKCIRPEEPDVYETADVQAGDIFFLCTDGVIEAFTNPDLINLFSAEQDIETLNPTCQFAIKKGSFLCFLCVL